MSGKKLRNAELKICSGDKIEKNRWAGDVARMGKRRGVHRVLVGKPEGKRPLGRLRRRWENYNTMDLQEVGCRLDETDSG